MRKKKCSSKVKNSQSSRKSGTTSSPPLTFLPFNSVKSNYAKLAQLNLTMGEIQQGKMSVGNCHCGEMTQYQKLFGYHIKRLWTKVTNRKEIMKKIVAHFLGHSAPQNDGFEGCFLHTFYSLDQGRPIAKNKSQRSGATLCISEALHRALNNLINFLLCVIPPFQVLFITMKKNMLLIDIEQAISQ